MELFSIRIQRTFQLVSTIMENVQGRKDTVSRCLCQSGDIESDRNPGIMHK